ncbi:TIGR03086 family metal-binding protein [Nakamurella leprariae]|uniref:TIGR03086 family protein n=1 Tax=Nakamurella leprariae TaxID=2803911 RepID=A0A938YEZ7_9ACTN|nr:TIGR03086 family metal-binding protein [Nakamurella leprariae]MBM9466625.1 TIGR03086 family protein [Nakamurella leprariae]
MDAPTSTDTSPETDPTGTAALMAAAAAPHRDLVAAAAGQPLDRPTPCRDWDLRALLNHLLFWTPVLAATGRREAPPAPDGQAAEESRERGTSERGRRPSNAEEDQVDLVTGDWAAALAAGRTELVAAWSDPQAWTGAVTMGGPDPLPAPMIGDMVLGELVLHGWDLGMAVGVTPQWPDPVLAAVLRGVEQMGPQGREMGVYADAVPVGPDAPLLHRVLALSGRDPHWTP